jgi:hypothetical protein
METIIAIGHIVGSIVVLTLVGFASVLIGAWESERNQKHLLEEASIQLGITVEDFNKEEIAPRIIKFASDRYSTELLRNRLSDLCGSIRTGWGWLGVLLQVAILGGVAWYTFADSLGTAVYAWAIVVIALVFWVVSIAFSFVVRLLTGRYPGQAKQARKAIASFASGQRAA